MFVDGYISSKDLGVVLTLVLMDVYIGTEWLRWDTWWDWYWQNPTVLTDYHNRPSNSISFMTAIVSTSGCLHSEFVCLLFLQSHRETDRFFASSGVQFPQSVSGQFHYRRAALSSQIKANVGNKTTPLLVNLNVDGAPISSKSHTVRRPDPSSLVLSLSSYRHSYIGLLFRSDLSLRTKQKRR